MDAVNEIQDSISSCQFGRCPSVPLPQALPFFAKTQHWKRRRLSNVWTQRWDRVNVLGSDQHGHTGCVNALSWAQNGELLISSGDDQDIRVWRMDSSDPTNEYPFTCQSVIHTGHTENVFNAQMLPSSTRIATVAGDSQVRVFDVGDVIGRSPTGNDISYSTREACIRVFRCHSRRTKRIITEDNPDNFLTVAEDGEVRQHDLRTPHSCAGGACPAPLVKLPHELSTIALSPLAPYEFVVGGESPFAHLFDRRHAGRYLREEWGMSPAVDDATTCVRRFSRRSRSRGEVRGYEHVTGVRMSAWNGHEVLLSYSADAVYLYSTRDDPGTGGVVRKSSILTPNAKRWKRDAVPLASSSADVHADIMVEDEPGNVVADQSRPPGSDTDDDEAMVDDFDAPDEDGSANDGEELEDDRADRADREVYKDTPVVYPRLRFSGHCNVKTVKDVNFLGPCDEFVTSGSDDGNFFVWDKTSAELVDVLQGDGSVVNVIEGHPNLPLLAVSGIDTTVKLFAPSRGPAAFSKHSNAASIIKHNARASRGTISFEMQLAHFVLRYDRALQVLRNGEADESERSARLSQCVNQ